jgi:predicted chitinase
MDRAPFFASLRRSIFSTGLKQWQVDGIEAILRACERHRIADGRHVANVLAQVYHETGGQMLPVKETVYASSIDRDPSDATVIARLEKAFAAGQLPWVKSPYWKDGWFGRGSIQLTHEDNYARLGAALGVDLVGNRDLALDLDVSASIAVVGMSHGLFTGKKLSDFFGAKSDPTAARAIVNGDTKTVGPKIATYHAGFLAALDAAGGWSVPPITADPEDADEYDSALNELVAWRAQCPADFQAVVAWLARMP